ncbi:MAG TPA: hypothetical protein VGJ04_09895, partial [Pirellulales bacterium]
LVAKQGSCVTFSASSLNYMRRKAMPSSAIQIAESNDNSWFAADIDPPPIFTKMLRFLKL